MFMFIMYMYESHLYKSCNMCVYRSVYVYFFLIICLNVGHGVSAEAAAKLEEQLLVRFPSAHLMDALGVIYPQYWTEKECDSNFEKHLRIIKAYYGHSMPFSTAAFPEGSVDPILSPVNLDMQISLFKMTMKENAHAMMKKPYHINSATRLWHSINANSFLCHSLSEYIKVIEVALVMVLGSVQDEKTFSQISFMKNKLRNRLTTNLSLTVGFKSQDFFTIETFPYDVAYESWRDETKRQCETE
jgi:hypothetical protein